MVKNHKHLSRLVMRVKKLNLTTGLRPSSCDYGFRDNVKNGNKTKK